jgi:hypothetical protein
VSNGVRVTKSRPPPIRARILSALTDEPISTLQLAEQAGITARRRGEVVKLACDVLEGEGLVERVGGRRHPKWRRPARSTGGMGTSCPPSSGWMASGLDERLAHELVQGLVHSAIAKGVDSAARLQEFRALQQAVIAMSRDPVTTQAAEQLVRAVDQALQELSPVKS